MVIIMSLSTFCAITVSVSDKRIYLLMHAIIHHVSSPLSHILKRSYLCLHAFSTLIFFSIANNYLNMHCNYLLFYSSITFKYYIPQKKIKVHIINKVHLP